MTPSEIEEIKKLVAAGETDVESEAVKNSELYKRLSPANRLYVTSDAKFKSEELLLVAKIAAVSPNLKSIEFHKQQFNEDGPQIFSELSMSHTIEEIDVNYSNFTKYIEETFGALTNLKSLKILRCGDIKFKYEEDKIGLSNGIAKLSSLEELSVRDTNIGSVAPEFIANLSVLDKLKKIDMYGIDLAYGKVSNIVEMAKNFSKYKSISEIVLCENNLRCAIVEMAEEFVKMFINANRNLKISLLGNFSGGSEGEKQHTKIADLKAKADEAKKETVYSQMASFLWSNKEAGIEHELYYPQDVACKIAGHIEWPTLEFQTRYSFIND